MIKAAKAARPLFHPALKWQGYQASDYSPCVIADASVTSDDSEAPMAAALEPPKPVQGKTLPTKGEIMKCMPALREAFLEEKSKNSSLRGVRGEKPSFPQVERPVLRLVSQPTLPQMPGNPGIDPDIDDVIRGIQTQVRRLSWSMKKVVAFIAERFNGKRRSQLDDEELFTLLYYLQSADSSS